TQHAIIKEHGVKGTEGVYFGGDKKGTTKIDNWYKLFDIPEYLGGIMIYGSATSSSGGPGSKNFTGEIVATIDFGTFSKTLSLINTALAGSPNYKPTHSEAIDKAVENVVELTKQQIESEKVKKNKPNST